MKDLGEMKGRWDGTLQNVCNHHVHTLSCALACMLSGAAAVPYMESLCTVGGTLGQVHTDNECVRNNHADKAGCL
jgi:hypothetical protein